MKIEFPFVPAVKTKCPACKEVYVGGPPGQDDDTDMWIAKHGKWHTDNPSSALPPPRHNGLLK